MTTLTLLFRWFSHSFGLIITVGPFIFRCRTGTVPVGLDPPWEWWGTCALMLALQDNVGDIDQCLILAGNFFKFVNQVPTALWARANNFSKLNRPVWNRRTMTPVQLWVTPEIVVQKKKVSNRWFSGSTSQFFFSLWVTHRLHRHPVSAVSISAPRCLCSILNKGWNFSRNSYKCKTWNLKAIGGREENYKTILI